MQAFVCEPGGWQLTSHGECTSAEQVKGRYFGNPTKSLLQYAISQATYPPNTNQPNPVANRSLQFPVTDVARAERSQSVSRSP